jgi:hypothetical protein
VNQPYLPSCHDPQVGAKNSDPVRDLADSGHARAVSAAEEASIRLHAVADDLDTAVLASWGEGMDRALEAIEGVGISPDIVT